MDSAVVVVADDLTGAADTSVAFATPRTPVRLALHNGAGPHDDVVVGVRAIDTDTREADSATAHRIVSTVASRITAAQVAFKKVDSTLRGNISAEVDAMRRALPGRLTIFAPAFPQLGRVTRGGLQHARGVPMPSGGSSSPECNPATSDLCELVRPLPVRRASLADVRSDRLPSLLSSFGANRMIAVCDAVTDADLDLIVAAGLSCPQPVLWVGAGGLAAALARRVCPAAQLVGWPAGDTAVNGPYLAVIGSKSATARRQAGVLVDEGAQWFDLSASTLADGSSRAELDVVREQVQLATTSGDVVVSVAGNAPAAAAGVIRRALAFAVAPAAANVPLLLLTGGATARAVLTEMRVGALELRAALAPGVVLAAAAGGAPPAIVLKAGSFGDDRVLLPVVISGLSRGRR
jgi:4-hydroxythreonine-4-phosphate dehydrogenase